MAQLQSTTITGTLTLPSYVAGFIKLNASGAVTMDTNTYITGVTSGMITTALGYTPVPTTRTLTINGTAYDLSADRSWTISSGVTSVSGSGSGISVSPTTGAVVVSNTGVTSNVAGTGISVSGATGAVTITNTGVTSIVAGTAITISGSTGAVTINNAGVTSVNGSTGAITGIITTSNYNSYSPTLTGGGASGTWSINITGTAGSASSVAWTGVTSGYRTNYDLGFEPADNSSSYAGFKFKTPGGTDGNAGYFLIRGGSDADVYTQNGITLVADAGWLTLAQRTQSNKGVRIMTGSASTTRLSIDSAGTSTFSGLVKSTVTDEAFRAQSDGTSTAWRGRVGSFNATANKSSFLGNYTGRPGVFGHDNGLTAWAELYVNTLGIYGQGDVYLSWFSYVKGNSNDTNYPILHSGNYNSYSPTLTGGGASGTWGISITGNAATASTSSQVTINYNNDSNSTYQLLWGSGNSVYGTAGVYVNPSSDYVYASSFVASSWFRSTGTTGWYNETYAGGIYMTESTTVRTYNSTGFAVLAGGTNTNYDASLYVEATNNNDWGIVVNKYNSSATEYGVEVRVGSGATYGLSVTGNGSRNFYVTGGGAVYSPIFYDLNDTSYYLDPANTGTSGYFAGVLRQNIGRYVRDSYYRTYSGYSDYYGGGTGGWYKAAEITLTSNCTGGVIYGTLYDNRYDGADTYQIAVVARAECDFTSNNQSHYINVGCTILGSTNYTNYRDKIRLVLVASSTNVRTYELQFYETPWNNDTWQLETNTWTIYTSPQAPGSATGTPVVNYISNQNADYQRANIASYSPVYYDSNDTGYYLDPNSTSNLYRVDAANQMRAPIFYDSNDTSYYLDPNGNSNLYNVYATNYFENVSGRATGSHGYVALFRSTQSASVNFIPFSFESTYGNHSWGIVARYRINTGSQDRPSIQFSYAGSDNRWNVGYNTSSDDNFRITQNMGYRNDNSTSDGWGTERFRIDTDGTTYIGMGGGTVYLKYGGNDKLWTGSDGIRVQGWSYHQDNGAGIHWPNNGWHLYPENANDFWWRSGNSTESTIHFSKGGNAGNYIHNASDNAIGFLSTGRSWILRVTNGGDAYVSGYLYVNGSGTSSSIYMSDTDEGQREIHCNSNRIGFLTQAGSWGAWLYDGADWEAASSVRAPIFYDSNDTNYYLDPASTGTSLYVAGSVRGTYYVSSNYSTTGYTQYKGYDNNNHFIMVRGRVTGNTTSPTYTGYHRTSLIEYAEANDDTGWFFQTSATGNYDIVARITRSYSQFEGSLRAPIFYDSQDTAYYLDPNGTSVLNTIDASTRARWGEPRWWHNRQAETSDQGYWTGTNGWATSYGNWDNAWRGGFSGWDIWGTGTAHPQGSGYIHAQGIVSGQHYANSDGSSAYGWMMVGAADATANRYWLRGKWSTTTSSWVEMITTGNIGSQSVNYASSAGNADTVDGYHGSNYLGKNGNSYYQADTWIQTNGYHGLYAPSWNGAHFYPNNASYGTWRIAGSRSGWNGIEFDTNSNGNISLMILLDGSTSGFHNNSYGWQIRWNNGNLYVGKGAYGGSEATVLDSSNAFYANNMDQYVRTSDTVQHANFGIGGLPFAGFKFTVVGGNSYFSMSGGSGGNIYAEGNIIAYYSDERLKDKKGKIENALDKIKQLNGFYYTNNDLAKSFGYTDEKVQVGLSAQEVQSVLPEVVTLAPFDVVVDEDTKVASSKSGEEYLTVSYDKLVPLLIEAIKEQQKQIDELKAKLV